MIHIYVEIDCDVIEARANNQDLGGEKKGRYSHDVTPATVGGAVLLVISCGEGTSRKVYKLRIR